MRPKVTVYITCHNYERFVTEAVESVYRQLLIDWELLIIDDGSTDNSWALIEDLAKAHPDKVRTHRNMPGKGLQTCANYAIETARGEYVIRLDADDFFDESALLTMSSFLDANPDIGLVYPNYIYIDEFGNILGVEQRKKSGTEAKVMDLPAHGACTMVRKRVLKAIGGYSLEHKAQDGHEVWLNVLNRYKIGNVETPLFFYRQHSQSLTRNEERLLNARRQIKRSAASKHEGEIKSRSVGIIPAKNTYREMPNVCLEPVGGRPLIDYRIEACLDSGALDHVMVATDDAAVVDHCSKFDGVLTYLRSDDLSDYHVKISEVVADAVDYLENQQSIYPDVLTVLNVHSPMIDAAHIDEAIDTLMLYDVDSVISIYEDRDLHFLHGEFGLKPLNQGAVNQLRLEREALYVDTNALRVLWRDIVGGSNLFGQTVGHIAVPWESSITVTDAFTRWLVGEIINRRQAAVGN